MCLYQQHQAHAVRSVTSRMVAAIKARSAYLKDIAHPTPPYLEAQRAFLQAIDAVMSVGHAQAILHDGEASEELERMARGIAVKKTDEEKKQLGLFDGTVNP